MRFSATFAILAAFIAKAAVSATSPSAYDSLMEARAEFVESALEEVWSRFYDELLDDVEARDYWDEEMYERAGSAAGAAKKFATELGTNMAQKAPGMIQQYQQGKESQARSGTPRMAGIVHQAQHQAGLKPLPKPLAVKAPLKPLSAESKWHAAKNSFGSSSKKTR